MSVARDRWGRPVVPHPFPGGEPVWHHRPSSIGKIVDDTYNLDLWQKRMVAKGLAARPDLLARVDAADPETSDGKRDLNSLCKQAQEAAAASRGANIGTALHAYTEQLDRGQQVQPLEQYQADLDAYRRTLDAHSITIDAGLMERFVVWPDRKVAGSCDRYAHWGGRVVALDLKTGASNPADFSLVTYAAQLACYANATHIWDGVDAEPLPEVDTEVGLIVWLPAGQGRCELIEVDITKGAEIVDLAISVYEARKDRGLGQIVLPSAADTRRGSEHGEPAPAAADDGGGLTHRNGDTVAKLRRRLQRLTDDTACTMADVKAAWPADCGKLSVELTDDQLDRIAGTVQMLEMGYGLDGADAPTVDEMVERLGRLPVDLVGLATTHAKALDPPIPNLRSGQATTHDLERLDAVVAPIEVLHTERITHLVNHLSPLDEDTADALIQWATEQRDEPLTAADVAALEALDNLEAERLSALAELYADEPDDLAAHLVDVAGSKSEVVAAGKAAAERHGLDVPKSTAEVAANRVLAALVTAKETA